MAFVIQRIKEEISPNGVMIIGTYVKREVLRAFSQSFGLAAPVPRWASCWISFPCGGVVGSEVSHAASVSPAYPSPMLSMEESLSWPMALFKFCPLIKMKGWQKRNIRNLHYEWC